MEIILFILFILFIFFVLYIYSFKTKKQSSNAQKQNANNYQETKINEIKKDDNSEIFQSINEIDDIEEKVKNKAKTKENDIFLMDLTLKKVFYILKFLQKNIFKKFWICLNMY